MFGILVSALFSILGWLVRSILVKFVLFFGLFFVTTEFMAVLIPSLPGSDDLFGAIGSLPPSMNYFMSVFQVPFGLSVCFSALVTRFVVRRIPLIG
ncbi:DUF2523 family protein [Achromobacter sp.]|uniref:DUF2523 family protein n=1 Tax=Achromobacter sp. TaxID=134375 RepID=UPI002F92CEA1